MLNIQIVNASLANILGGIGAGIDDVGWISTSYLIAEIVVIPLSGRLAQVFSIRIYLLTNAFLFLLFSAARALAQDLPQMIALRAVQGFSGGVLIPLAFTLIITLLPKARSGWPCLRSPRPLRPRSGRPSAAISPSTLAGNTSFASMFVVPGAIMIGMLYLSRARGKAARVLGDDLCLFDRMARPAKGWPMPLPFAFDIKSVRNVLAAMRALAQGQPGFFKPHFQSPFFSPFFLPFSGDAATSFGNYNNLDIVALDGASQVR